MTKCARFTETRSSAPLLPVGIGILLQASVLTHDLIETRVSGSCSNARSDLTSEMHDPRDFPVSSMLTVANEELSMQVRPQSILAFFCAVALTMLGSAGPLSAVDLQPLEIVSKTGVHTFAVEMALTPEEQAKGLMFRRELPEGQGMLFDFQHEQPATFWMKNTYVPLDMIFIRADGTILRIAENTVPLSEALVPSGGPVRAVLEVVAGTARRLGIAPGDRVAHPIFGAR
jgi:uncharacterized protein